VRLMHVAEAMIGAAAELNMGMGYDAPVYAPVNCGWSIGRQGI